MMFTRIASLFVAASFGLSALAAPVASNALAARDTNADAANTVNDAITLINQVVADVTPTVNGVIAQINAVVGEVELVVELTQLDTVLAEITTRVSAIVITAESTADELEAAVAELSNIVLDLAITLGNYPQVLLVSTLDLNLSNLITAILDVTAVVRGSLVGNITYAILAKAQLLLVAHVLGLTA